MLVAGLVAPQPGMDVLDLCSAPGGKTTHLAQLMGNSGSITACDVHQHKLELIGENAARLGISIIQPTLNEGAVLRADRAISVLCVEIHAVIPRVGKNAVKNNAYSLRFSSVYKAAKVFFRAERRVGF